MSRELAAAVEEAARGRGPWRGARGRARPPTIARPARAASIVIRVSHAEAAARAGSTRRARAGERARWPESGSRGAVAGAEADRARATVSLRDPEAAALRDARSAATTRSASLAEQRRAGRRARSASQSTTSPGRRRALRRGERLALAAARQPQDDGAGGLGLRGGAVARAVVGDDHLGAGERRAAAPRTVVADPALLVARRDEDGDRLTTRAGQRPARPAAGRRRARRRRSGSPAAPRRAAARAPAAPRGVSTLSTLEKPSNARSTVTNDGSAPVSSTPTAGTAPSSPS